MSFEFSYEIPESLEEELLIIVDAERLEDNSVIINSLVISDFCGNVVRVSAETKKDIMTRAYEEAEERL